MTFSFLLVVGHQRSFSQYIALLKYILLPCLPCEGAKILRLGRGDSSPIPPLNFVPSSKDSKSSSEATDEHKDGTFCEHPNDEEASCQIKTEMDS